MGLTPDLNPRTRAPPVEETWEEEYEQRVVCHRRRLEDDRFGKYRDVIRVEKVLRKGFGWTDSRGGWKLLQEDVEP